jgi:hypothetical protein
MLRVISAAVTAVLITCAILLGGAPVWFGVGVAGAAAAALGVGYWRDRRRGRRWL